MASIAVNTWLNKCCTPAGAYDCLEGNIMNLKRGQNLNSIDVTTPSGTTNYAFGSLVAFNIDANVTNGYMMAAILALSIPDIVGINLIDGELVFSVNAGTISEIEGQVGYSVVVTSPGQSTPCAPAGATPPVSVLSIEGSVITAVNTHGTSDGVTPCTSFFTNRLTIIGAVSTETNTWTNIADLCGLDLLLIAGASFTGSISVTCSVADCGGSDTSAILSVPIVTDALGIVIEVDGVPC